MRIKINDEFELPSGIKIMITDMAYDYNKNMAIVTYTETNVTDPIVKALYNDEFIEFIAPSKFKEMGFPIRIKK